MGDEEKSNLEKAAESYERLCGFRTDAEFRDDLEEKSIRLQQATLEAVEAVYFQNKEILEQLKSR